MASSGRILAVFIADLVMWMRDLHDDICLMSETVKDDQIAPGVGVVTALYESLTFVYT